MTNLKYLNELGKMFMEWKVSLFKLLRTTIKKGLSRMITTNVNDYLNPKFLSMLLEENLSEKQFSLITELLNKFKIELQRITQEFINEEIQEFRKENPDVVKKGVREQISRTPFGEIKTKHQRFRNAEFESTIIKKQSQTFFLNTIFLALMIGNGITNYANIKSIFSSLNMPMYNDEISRVIKIVREYNLSNNHSLTTPHNSHQLVAYFDAVHVKHKEKVLKYNEITQCYEKKIIVSRKVVINAIGIDSNGIKRTLGSVIADYENSEGYRKLFQKLWDKGITQIDLIVSDGTNALDDPILEYYPNSRRQRCVAHFIRDVKKLVCKKDRKLALDLIWKLFRCNSKLEASLYFVEISEYLECNFPALFNKMKKIANSLIAFYDLPQSLWRAAYTNNVSENYNSVFRKFSPNSTCFYTLSTIEYVSELTSMKMDATYKKYDLK